MLADFFEDVAARRKTVVVYGTDSATDVLSQFETRNVTVEHRSLPPGGPDGFAVVRDDGEFVGAFALSTLAEVLEPPLHRPWERSDVSEPWRSLYVILDNSLFTSLDRRQLLAASREIENRAWRVGEGTLRAGFQRPGAFADQAIVYRRLAAETDLSVRVYLRTDQSVSTVPGIDVRTVSDGEIGRYWFVVYDPPGDGSEACALLARESSPGSYRGFWTYDPDLVASISSYLERTYD